MSGETTLSWAGADWQSAAHVARARFRKVRAGELLTTSETNRGTLRAAKRWGVRGGEGSGEGLLNLHFGA